jgi:hypothetical protein
MYHIYIKQFKPWIGFLPLLLLLSCQKEFDGSVSRNLLSESIITSETNKENTFYGHEVQMGYGKARSWITVSKAGIPLALGIEMTADAFLNLPMDKESLGTLILPLHHKAKDLTAFDHITVDWEPFGHEPLGIYDIAHFDFHFYKIPVETQYAIPSYEVDPAAFDDLPEADFIPPLYFHGPGGVAQMGAHWVDLLSPEFNGEIFTHTFLFGSYSGEVTFYESMITKATIESGITVHKEIRQPQKFSPKGVFYPTSYSIYKDSNSGKHYVTLEGFVKR